MPKKKSRRPAARNAPRAKRPPTGSAAVRDTASRDAALGSRALDLLQPAGRADPPAASRPAATTDTDRSPAGDKEALSVSAPPWSEALADREPQALGLTYRFDTDREGDPYVVTVRFRGHRLGVEGRPGPKDVLDQQVVVRPVLPGSGEVAVTARALDVAPGTWQVQAEAEASRALRSVQLPRARATGATGFAPVVRVMAPGVTLGAWPGFVAAGVVLGLVTQALLAQRVGLPAGRTALVTLVACLVGLVGAKAYFLALHRDRQVQGLWMVGMAIQGFVIAMIATALLGAALTGLDIGTFLDVTGAALLLGMSLGRVGCFFGGCCAGRPTASRWGLWSSDRLYGMRRVPTQLWESATALVLGLGAAAALVFAEPTPRGVVLLAGLSAYTLARQVLFPFRDLPRKTRSGRVVAMVTTAAVLVGSVAVGVLA